MDEPKTYKVKGINHEVLLPKPRIILSPHVDHARSLMERLADEEAKAPERIARYAENSEE